VFAGVAAGETWGMGIYDREYYRKEGPRYLDAFGFNGAAVKWLILINAGLFIVDLLTRNNLFSVLELDPRLVMEGQFWRLFTYAFLHDTSGWQHVVFNMLFLWWFGGDIEQIYGTREFVLFYLTAALLGGIAFTGWAVVNNERAICIGASGAVTAVMVVYACHFPARIIYVFLVLPVPIWIFVGFQVFSDFLIAASGRRSQVAVHVHLAGAAFGFLYFKSHMRMSSWLPNFSALRGQGNRQRLRMVRPDGEVVEVVPVGAPPASHVDEQLEAKVDAVLEKVARTGQASLTDPERQILLRASEIYKRRRT